MNIGLQPNVRTDPIRFLSKWSSRGPVVEAPFIQFNNSLIELIGSYVYILLWLYFGYTRHIETNFNK